MANEKKLSAYFRTSVSLRQDENKLFSELIHKPNGLHWHGLGAKRNICTAVQMLRSKGMQFVVQAITNLNAVALQLVLLDLIPYLQRSLSIHPLRHPLLAR